MKTINASTSNRKYDVLIGNDICKNIKDIIECYFKKYRKTIVVTNDIIFKLYRDLTEKHIIRPLNADIIILNDGERYKTLASVAKIYERLYSLKFSRDDLLIALGGGVIGDMAGFAAATYNRGIKLVHVPTTIISQVDSSIGGKVVVNYRATKNLIGCFYQPHLVVSDLDFFNTLEREQILNGLGEVVKYGIVFDKAIIDNILKYSDDPIDLTEFINSKNFQNICYKCADIKIGVVKKDEYDMDYRNLLNFGHTIGHALESESKLKKSSHGIYVALGMLCAIDMSISIGILKKETKDFILKIFKILGLPISIKGIDIDKALDKMSFDKKISAGKNKFILLEDINKPVFYYDVDVKIIKESIIKNMI
jgi:3-dehydroquinate synthase